LLFVLLSSRFFSSKVHFPDISEQKNSWLRFSHGSIGSP
jgi:hypothetical protein